MLSVTLPVDGGLSASAGHFDLPARADRRELIDYFLGLKAHEPALDHDRPRDNLAGNSEPWLVEIDADETGADR